jgi:hypothetical protein
VTDNTEEYPPPYNRESEAPTQIKPPSQENGDVDIEDVPPVQGFTPGADYSVLDTFRQELQELAEAEDVLIPVKGYEATGLQIKYRMPESGSQLERITREVTRRYKTPYERNLNTAMEMMIYLCEGLYVQPDGVDEPVPLDFEETGQPVRFDERLATLIGLSGDGAQVTAKMIVRKLFGNNELAIMTHAERLQRWLSNTKADLSAEIWQLGE